MPLLFKRSRCTGCKLCQLACAAVHEDAFTPEKARLKVVHEYLDTGIHIGAAICTFCKTCEAECPEAAISNNGSAMMNRYAKWILVFPEELIRTPQGRVPHPSSTRPSQLLSMPSSQISSAPGLITGSASSQSPSQVL